MIKPNQRIKEIKKWAKERAEVRALILYGSQAQKGKADPLSDIDLALFVTDPDSLITQPDWAEDFGSIWLRVGENHETAYLDKILYDDGTMVEFVIYPIEALAKMQENLSKYLEPGYKILVDKDKAVRDLPKPSGETRTPLQPTAEQYESTLKAFWLDAYQLAKYLLRGELWRAKHYDWQMKQHLLEMMGWHALLVRGQEHFTTYEGKRLQKWIDPDTYIGLMTVFGRFYPADSWRALEDTIKRFSLLSGEVADVLQADPRPTLEQKFQSWLIAQREETD